MPLTDVNPYVTEFERFDEAYAGRGPAWLRATRQKALARFSALGFPTTRHEEWRFTNVAPIAEAIFRLPVEDQHGLRRHHLDALRLTASHAIEVVFVNGRFAPGLSDIGELPHGLSVRGLADALATEPARLARHLAAHARYEDQAFVALNTAFLRDGALIETAPNAVIERPVHVLFVSAGPGEVSHPRVLMLAGRNSQVQIVETYAGLPTTAARAGSREPGPDASFTNAVSEIVLDDGAVVEHYRVQRERTTTFHVSTTQLLLAHSSTVTSHSFSFGGAIVRNDVNVVMGGEGGDCTLNGLYLADGTQVVDNHTFIDHAQPHCGSHEIYKGILDGRAHAVFNGKILVRPDAQKTDAKQTNKTLLLSDDAQINTKPQLEIFANDVKCTHGATVGQLSADALFYLRARGIDRRTARQMLVRAFAADITGRTKIEALRDYLDQAVLGMHAAGALPSSDEGLPRAEAGL